MDIANIKKTITQIAPSYPVQSIDLFGSYAEGKNTRDSDIDLLVYFDNNKATLFDLSGLKLDLQGRLKKKVDLVAGPLSPTSTLVIKEKIRIYEA